MRRSRIGSKSFWMRLAGYIDENGHRHRPAQNFTESMSGPITSIFPSSTSSSSRILRYSTALEYFSTHLHVHRLPPHDFAFEGGGIGHGDVDFLDLDLDAPDLYRQGDDLLVVELAHDVLVGANACGPDLGDLGVGDHGEPHVDGPGAGGILQVVHLPEREPEREDALLAIHEAFPRLALPEASEGQGRADGPVQGIDGTQGIPAVGNDIGLPSIWIPSARSWSMMLVPLTLEPAKIRMLRFCSSRTIFTAVFESGAAPRIAAKPGILVHQLDPQGAHDRVREGPIAVRLGLGSAEVAQRHDHLLREERGDSCVERRPQVGEPDRIAGDLMEQAFRVVENGRHVADLLYFLPRRA